MLAYHVDTKAIIVSAFQSRNDRHRIAAYNSIMYRLKSKGHSVDIQDLNNEDSAEYCCTIVDEWNCTFQLVPLDVHLTNISELSILTLKAQFIFIPIGVSASFPNSLWDQLLPQT